MPFLPDLTKSGGFIGMALMAADLFLVLGTGNIAPWWVTVLLTLWWLVVFIVACRWFVTHPVRVFFLPVLVFAVWLPVILVGTASYGWT